MDERVEDEEIEIVAVLVYVAMDCAAEAERGETGAGFGEEGES